MLVDTVRKVCATCGATKPLTEFHRSATGKDGRRGSCGLCQNEKSRVNRQENVEREQRRKRDWYQEHKDEVADRMRESHLIRRYGITTAEYETLLEAQNGVCAICARPESSSRYGYLAVDHDHETGVVRGLLCGGCNKALGGFGDSEELLAKAIAYLAGVSS